MKQPRPAKTLAAYFTLTRQRMRSNVHLERSQRRVRLLAVFTSEMLLYLRAAVKLLVLRQTAERRIALAAPITLVSSYAGRVLRHLGVFLFGVELFRLARRQRRSDSDPNHAVDAVVRRVVSA